MDATATDDTTSASTSTSYSLEDTERCMQTQMFASYDPKVQLLDPVSMPWNHHTGKEYVREHLYQIIGRALHLWASSTVTDLSLIHISEPTRRCAALRLARAT